MHLTECRRKQSPHHIEKFIAKKFVERQISKERKSLLEEGNVEKNAAEQRKQGAESRIGLEHARLPIRIVHDVEDGERKVGDEEIDIENEDG